MALLQRLRSAWAPSTKLAVRTFSSAPAAAEIPDSWRNPAAVLHGIDDIRFEDVPLPDKVADGHVRVQMRAVGICGSDVHYYKKGRVGHFVVNAPMVLGHESAGDIIECGPGVTSRQVGDRVALEPGVPCWSNRMSRQGRYNLDPDVKFFATPPVHGSLARYVDHPADFCFKMPDSLSYEQGAMVEPLSNAVHACRRGGVGPGKKVAILGAGPIGLMVLAAAKAFSASSVAITDIRPDNLPVAKQLGAKHALDQSKAMSANDTVEALKAVFAEGPDIVIDCVGFESTITVSLQSLVHGTAHVCFVLHAFSHAYCAAAAAALAYAVIAM
ncbi:MAG: sorbitol dehydrogenase-2 [Trebouxia sp. A1-2]|nr:MAG: sorbitol dehydrogenase-2 [Trebouxia sp. A1-2]